MKILATIIVKQKVQLEVPDKFKKLLLSNSTLDFEAMVLRNEFIDWIDKNTPYSASEEKESESGIFYSAENLKNNRIMYEREG